MTALQVAMAARAGKLMPRESHLVDRAGEPISTCRLASIPDNVMGLERFARLAAPPLVQAVHPWAALHRARGHEPPPVPVVLALPPEDRPGFDPRIARELLDRIEALSHVAIDRKKSWLLHRCRAGGVMAMCEAIERLGGGRGDDLVVVGGVDSYFDPDVLEHLDSELRLHSLATENGFIPGEGAAFLALAPRSRATGMHRFAQVLGAAVEREPRPYGHEEPCQGLGMTLAMRKAAATVGINARRVPWALTDVANERHRVDEWQLAFSRMFAIFSAPVFHQQPLLEMGDVGAASAAILAAIGCVGWQTGAHKGDCVMIATHSDAHDRGALLLARDAEAAQ
jgi:3-oxoacyl-[acyl-carrier-protein] synthase-1